MALKQQNFDPIEVQSLNYQMQIEDGARKQGKAP